MSPAAYTPVRFRAPISARGYRRRRKLGPRPASTRASASAWPPCGESDAGQTKRRPAVPSTAGGQPIRVHGKTSFASGQVQRPGITDGYPAPDRASAPSSSMTSSIRWSHPGLRRKCLWATCRRHRSLATRMGVHDAQVPLAAYLGSRITLRECGLHEHPPSDRTRRGRQEDNQAIQGDDSRLQERRSRELLQAPDQRCAFDRRRIEPTEAEGALLAVL